MSGVTILFADNDPDFLKTRVEFLENAGYHVLKADTPEEARRQLHGVHLHLAILDVRLVDEDDEKDTSGLTLAKDPAFRIVPKIILTGFPTVEAVREALGPALEGLPPAVDFVDKKEQPEAMIRAVEKALDRYVRVNRVLEIYGDAHARVSFLHLAGLLQPDAPDAALLGRAEEVEDLFRRLFYDYRQLRILRLFWQESGRACLSVLARSAHGTTDARIVTCGEREALARDVKLMQELAPNALQGLGLEGTGETMHLAAVVSALPDGDLETVRPLRALLDDGRERPIRAAVDHLLTKSLEPWHRRGVSVEDQDLMALYRWRAGLGENGLPREEVDRRVDAIVQATRPFVDVQRGSDSLVFRFPDHPALTCPDPVAAAYGSLEGYGASPCWISPGQLTADNILVDGAQRTWLTNFVQAGQAPVWWDLVRLEAMARFDICHASDMVACLELEECLSRASQLDDRLRAQDVDSDLKRNVTVIEQVRHQAGREIGAELLPYEAGLLVCAVGAMARHDPGLLYVRAERMRNAHLLLAAAMLAGRVAELAERAKRVSTSEAETGEAEPVPGIRLDADGVQVWIGQERIAVLSGHELKLFLCLYEQAGKVVSRKALVEQVYDQPYEPTDRYQEANLNSLVRRLREKIEPVPGRPRYLRTVRGQGYQM